MFFFSQMKNCANLLKKYKTHFRRFQKKEERERNNERIGGVESYNSVISMELLGECGIVNTLFIIYIY